MKDRDLRELLEWSSAVGLIFGVAFALLTRGTVTTRIWHGLIVWAIYLTIVLVIYFAMTYIVYAFVRLAGALAAWRLSRGNTDPPR